MRNPELFSNAITPLEENQYSQFGEGARVERQGDAIYIYDQSGKRRWYIHEFVMDWEKKKHRDLELQGQTSGGTWHLLMGVYQARDADTDAEIDTGVTVDVIKESTHEFGDLTTPGKNIQYSLVRGGIFFEGWEGGYYGKREDIEEDLQGLHAVARTPDELPRIIDVKGTVQRLVGTFWEGKFEPPQFAIPVAPKRFPTLRTAAHMFRRLHPVSPNNEIQKE